MQRTNSILTLLRMHLEHVKMFTQTTNSYVSSSECPLPACLSPEKVWNVLFVLICSVLWHTEYACQAWFSVHGSQLKLS